MDIQDVMKMFGLNASGAKKRLQQMQAMEPELSAESAESAESVDSAESANTDEKWLGLVEKLDAYTGRMTQDNEPHVQDLEKHLGIDLTPETRTKLWNKYREHKTNADS